MDNLAVPQALAALKAEVAELRDQVRVLTERAERAEALADHDVLTPVFNRRGFLAVVRRSMAYCRRHQVMAVLIYLDLDGFKAINDQWGHPAGDAVLIGVAERLKSQVRESDAVGRLGGDEFALLLMNATAEDAQIKMEQMQAELIQTPPVWQGVPLTLGGSFGLKAFADHQDAEQWLAEADAAMWLRKKAGQNVRRDEPIRR